MAGAGDLVEMTGDRWRIVIDASPLHRRRLFEALVPADASALEIEVFLREVLAILRKRRAAEQSTDR